MRLLSPKEAKNLNSKQSSEVKRLTLEMTEELSRLNSELNQKKAEKEEVVRRLNEEMAQVAKRLDVRKAELENDVAVVGAQLAGLKESVEYIQDKKRGEEMDQLEASLNKREAALAIAEEETREERDAYIAAKEELMDERSLMQEEWSRLASGQQTLAQNLSTFELMNQDVLTSIANAEVEHRRRCEELDRRQAENVRREAELAAQEQLLKQREVAMEKAEIIHESRQHTLKAAFDEARKKGLL